MSYMLEVYYKAPANPAKEAAITRRIASLGGRLDYREDATEHTGICLAYELDDPEKAMKAAVVGGFVLQRLSIKTQQLENNRPRYE